MAAGGDALAHLGDGRVVFVDGALPGERVVVDVHTSKKDFARARVLDVLDPSLARVAPPCPAVAAGCGGCGWQHVDPAAQLGLKTDVVREAFARTARMPSAVVTAGASVPAWGYRTTLRLAVAPNGRVGLRAAASHRVVELADCPVAHPLLAGLLPGLRVRGADEVTVRVSVATGEVTALPSAAGAVVDGLPDDAGVGPAAVLRETVFNNGVYYVRNGPGKLRVQGIQTVVVVGLTAEHCVSTTARMADDLGFTTVVVADATASHERTGYDGTHYSAETIHTLSMVTLQDEFATILQTDQVLDAG